MATLFPLFLQICALFVNFPTSDSNPGVNKTAEPLPVYKICHAFYLEFMDHAMNLTECELKNSSPFRLCTNCVREYTITRETYKDFVSNPELEECRKMYLNGNRVQVIPTIQKNIEDMWDNSQCKGCTTDVHLNRKTNEVSFSVPDTVASFLLLKSNFTACLHAHTTKLSSGILHPVGKGSNETVCQLCKTEYVALNNHYTEMTESDDGKSEGLCMDLVDMMNYTRHNWSVEFDCSHRSGDNIPVIFITLIVVVSPLFFYGILKITGKEHKNEVFRQKRLTSSLAQDTASISSFTFAAGDSMGGNRLRPVS